MSPVWTILIPTLGQRRDLLARLLAVLMPQVDAAAGAVRVLAWWDNGETSLPDKRQALVEAVETEYLSFVDDDDLVSEDFVALILDAMASGPDFVGSRGEVRMYDAPHGIASTSLRHGDWIDRPGGELLRDITHISPMRAAIARTADFRSVVGNLEDRHWAAQLRAGGLLRTEVYVDRIIYHYLCVPTRSAWTSPDRIHPTDGGRPWQRLEVASPYFSWYPGGAS